MYASLITAQFAVLSALTTLGDTVGEHLHARRHASRRDGGQSTAEYALVLLGAATVAVVFIAWAGKSSRIERLFNAVLDSVIGRV